MTIVGGFPKPCLMATLVLQYVRGNKQLNDICFPIRRSHRDYVFMKMISINIVI